MSRSLEILGGLAVAEAPEERRTLVIAAILRSCNIIRRLYILHHGSGVNV